MEQKKKTVGAIWLKKDKNGNTYMSGSVDKEVTLTPGSRFTVFKNGFKKEDKHPDYVMYLSEPMQGQAAPF